MKAKTCPACGAENSENALNCAYCGSKLYALALSFEERNRIMALAQEWNNWLEKELKRINKLFHLSSWLLLFPVLVFVLFIFQRWSISGIKLLLLFILLLVLVLSLGFLFWQRHLANKLARLFFERIEPGIKDYLQDSELPRWQLEKMISENLEKGAPLTNYLLGKARQNGED